MEALSRLLPVSVLRLICQLLQDLRFIDNAWLPPWTWYYSRLRAAIPRRSRGMSPTDPSSSATSSDGDGDSVFSTTSTGTATSATSSTTTCYTGTPPGLDKALGVSFIAERTWDPRRASNPQPDCGKHKKNPHKDRNENWPEPRQFRASKRFEKRRKQARGDVPLKLRYDGRPHKGGLPNIVYDDNGCVLCYLPCKVTLGQCFRRKV